MNPQVKLAAVGRPLSFGAKSGFVRHYAVPRSRARLTFTTKPGDHRLLVCIDGPKPVPPPPRQFRPLLKIESGGPSPQSMEELLKIPLAGLKSRIRRHAGRQQIMISIDGPKPKPAPNPKSVPQPAATPLTICLDARKGDWRWKKDAATGDLIVSASLGGERPKLRRANLKTPAQPLKPRAPQ